MLIVPKIGGNQMRFGHMFTATSARVGIALAAAAGLAAATPSRAEVVGPKTITQSETRSIDMGFLPFDESLGVLLSVELTVTTDFRRRFLFNTTSSADTAFVSWDASDEVWCNLAGCTNLSAKGSTVLDLPTVPPGSPGLAYKEFEIVFGGNPTFTILDPARLSDFRAGDGRLYLTEISPGFYDDSLLDIFDSDIDGNFINITRNLCSSSFVGSCENSRYTLKYIYAPGGVPEPATWSMMILGFGFVGGMMRRRKAADRGKVAYS